MIGVIKIKGLKVIISKELLSEVLNIPCHWLQNIEMKDNILMYEKHNEIFRGDSCAYWSSEQINIYELAHKCKEWAEWTDWDNRKNYFISSGKEPGGWVCWINRGWTDGINYLEKEFTAGTEPEAIFKAYEWILENKG